MNLYHATTIEIANRIISDGVIKRTSEETTTYDNTTMGFIYLATTFEKSVDMGIRSYLRHIAIGNNPSGIVIFRLDNKDMTLLPDYDELHEMGREEIDTLEGSIAVANSVSVAQDIPLLRYNVEFVQVAKVPKDPYKLLDNLPNEKLLRWRKEKNTTM